MSFENFPKPEQKPESVESPEEKLEQQREARYKELLEKERLEKEKHGPDWTTHLELQRQEARKLGLPENALWEEIRDKRAQMEEEKRQQEYKEKIERERQETIKAIPEYDKKREYLAGSLGLGKNATFEDILNAWRETDKNANWGNEERVKKIARYLGLPEDTYSGSVRARQVDLLNEFERIKEAKDRGWGELYGVEEPKSRKKRG